MRSRRTWWLALIVVIAVAGCAEPAQPAASADEAPSVDTDGMEPPVIRALEAARRAVLAEPGSAQAWGAYGVELDAHELTVAAETCYRRAAELAPDDVRWPYLRAVALENAGAEPATVLTLYTTALALEPDFPPAHFRVGELLSREGRLAEAAAAYRAALAVDGELAVAHRGLAQTLLLLDRAQEAIEQLDHAERCVPGDRAVWAARAQCLAQLGRLDEARAAAERAGELEDLIALPDPIRHSVRQRCRSAEACRRRAGELVAAGDPAGAARELETVVEARPADVTALLMRGRCLAEAGRSEDAEEAWRAALSLDDELVEAHLGLATIALRAGQRAAAIDHLGPVIRLEPRRQEAHAMLATALLQAGRTAEAIVAFETAASLGPLDARIEVNRGAALVRGGDFVAALECYRRAQELEPNLAGAHLGMAVALERLGLHEEAREHRKRAAELR